MPRQVQATRVSPSSVPFASIRSLGFRGRPVRYNSDFPIIGGNRVTVAKPARYYCTQCLNYALARLFKHETMGPPSACYELARARTSDRLVSIVL